MLTDGQQMPSSFAWSASEIKTAFLDGSVRTGQHADMTLVDTQTPAIFARRRIAASYS